MMAGRAGEARDKYIEAIIALPAPKSWTALANWAARMNYRVSPPKIDRPQIADTPQAPAGGDGQSVWVNYSSARADWRKSVFSEKHPAEKQYRHTIEEEAAALSTVADAVDLQKPSRPDPQLAILAELRKAGLLQAWIFLSASDTGIAQDYTAYRDGHREQLRTYIEKFVIRSAGN